MGLFFRRENTRIFPFSTSINVLCSIVDGHARVPCTAQNSRGLYKGLAIHYQKDMRSRIHTDVYIEQHVQQLRDTDGETLVLYPRTDKLSGQITV